MSKPLVNGETAHSKTLHHLTSYPVVHDGIDVYKSNSYGQKSINLTSDAFEKLVKPFFPYLQTPYSYARPYLERADSFGDDGLTKIDHTFPIVTEDTEKLKSTILDYAFLPLRLADNGRNYVVGTFNDEYSKTSGNGIIKLAKAAISTEIKFGLDAYVVLVNYLNKAKDTSEKKADEVNKKISN